MSAPHSKETQAVADAQAGELHVGLYIKVGLMSAVITSMTVALSFLTRGNILIAMIFATINAVMIAWYTMHLKSEKGSIYRAVFLSLFFLADLILITLLAYEDRIHL
ncbi:MAG TPA: cytochrome C oxidase subunit IV family protein [Chthoniobacterales bacterium]|jgi:caa(3)-type oxidase subunit IV